MLLGACVAWCQEKIGTTQILSVILSSCGSSIHHKSVVSSSNSSGRTLHAALAINAAVWQLQCIAARWGCFTHNLDFTLNFVAPTSHSHHRFPNQPNYHNIMLDCQQPENFLSINWNNTSAVALSTLQFENNIVNTFKSVVKNPSIIPICWVTDTYVYCVSLNANKVLRLFNCCCYAHPSVLCNDLQYSSSLSMTAFEIFCNSWVREHWRKQLIVAWSASLKARWCSPKRIFNSCFNDCYSPDWSKVRTKR